jgi:hypothetical protein
MASQVAGFFLLKLNIKNAENLYVTSLYKKPRTDAQKNVEHLRYRLIRYKIVGIAPPVTLLIELKMAENLLKLESIDTIRINIKA